MAETVTFNPDDVLTLARAIRDSFPVQEREAGYNAWLECAFCHEHQSFDYSGPYRQDPKEPFPHALTCPVVIARDVLTGAPADSENTVGKETK